LPGLCLQLGESPSRLRLAFRRELDTSPTHYLTMFKLCRARDDLSRGHEVASVAYKHGFHNLGRFAGRYKHAFGEYPSETLAGRGVFRGSRPPSAVSPQMVDVLRRALSQQKSLFVLGRSHLLMAFQFARRVSIFEKSRGKVYLLWNQIMKGPALW